MAFAARQRLLKHIHHIEDWPTYSSVVLELGGVQTAHSFSAPTTPSGLSGTSSSNTTSTTTFNDLLVNSNQVLLKGDNGDVVYYWNLGGSITAGDSVTFDAGAFPMLISGANANMVIACMEHCLGLGTMIRPDSLWAALGSFTGFPSTWTEMSRAGYSRLDASGIWSVFEQGMPAEDFSWAENNDYLTWGPAGEDWPGGEKFNTAMVDSGGNWWWNLETRSFTIVSGDRLIYDPGSLLVSATE